MRVGSQVPVLGMEHTSLYNLSYIKEYSPHLENKAVVCGGLVFALQVLSVVHVDVVKLHKTHQVTGGLAVGGGESHVTHTS